MYTNTLNDKKIIMANNLVNNKEYKKAYDLLKSINNKCSEWFYLTGLSAMKIGYYEEGDSLISKAQALDPENIKFKEAMGNFNLYRDNYRSSSYDYNRRRRYDSGGGCCCCDDCCCCCPGDDTCGCCMKLWCLDSCCECMGGDLITCI